MRITYGNINLRKPKYPICITSNDYITKNGRCVMGRGIALDAKSVYPAVVGWMTNSIKNKPMQVDRLSKWLIRFPVKPKSKICKSKDDYVGHAKYRVGDLIPGFHCVADVRIIKRSARQLMALLDSVKGLDRVILPRPGCGAGELNWGTVLKAIAPILDDRVEVRTFRPKDKTVFISGSRSIKTLSRNVQKRLFQYIEEDIKIIVGDCHGVDALVQDFCKSYGYTQVEVYHIFKKPRYNAGFVEHFVSGDRWFLKDIVMGSEADECFVIWDGKSRGSKSNIDRAKRENKPVWCYKGGRIERL